MLFFRFVIFLGRSWTCAWIFVFTSRRLQIDD